MVRSHSKSHKTECYDNDSPSDNDNLLLLLLLKQFLTGLIDFLLSKHRIAKELREKLIFKVKCFSSFLYMALLTFILCRLVSVKILLVSFYHKTFISSSFGKCYFSSSCDSYSVGVHTQNFHL